MNIGRFARWYRSVEYAAYGRALERARFAFLPRLADARRILLLGEGDGRTLQRLSVIAPRAHFDIFELSPEMIALAKQRAPDPARVEFHCEDARRATWTSARYDAVVTHFFLDCFEPSDAAALIRQLANALAPDGLWLIAEFAIPPQGWRRLHAQLWIGLMYRFFRAATGLQTQALPPIEALMRQAGLCRVECEQQRAGLIVSELWRHA